jgi:acetate---CoA ligase (ADP-forming)
MPDNVRDRPSSSEWRRDNALATILSPRSVVVVGASDARANTMPAAPVSNLLDHGYPGRIHVVNPSRKTVFGVPAVARIADLPEVPETAVIVVAADLVPGVVRELGELGVPSATVIAAGFGEGAAGESGVDRADKLASAVRDTGIRLLGPNTTGVLNTLDAYVPRASRNHPRKLSAGSFAIIGQSGALGNGILNRALRYGTRVGYLVATGNQLDLDVWDVAAYALTDDRIKVISVIVESVADASKIAAVARLARENHKPIVALRLGVSERGMDVVATHSGSLAGSADVAAAFFDEVGIVDVRELDELWEVSRLVQCWGAPTRRASQIAIVSTSGGDAALAADIAATTTLELPPLPPSTTRVLHREFSYARPSNPFDLTAEFMGRAGQIESAVRAFSEAEEYDALLFSSLVTVSSYAEPMYRELISALKDGDGRAAVALRSGLETVAGVDLLHERDIPVFEGVERALRAIDRYVCYGMWHERSATAEWQDGWQTNTRRTEAIRRPSCYWSDRQQLSGLGIAFNPAKLVSSPDAAARAAEDLGYPVAMKISAPGSGHKSASGGVRLLVSSGSEVRHHAADMLGSFPVPVDLRQGLGLVVERQVAGVAELFVGFHRDEVFGPVVVLGLGGVWTEAIRDTATVRWPAGADRIRECLVRTRIGAALLTGGIDVTEPLARAVHAVGSWFSSETDVKSIDLNPILVTADGEIVAVDARIQ